MKILISPAKSINENCQFPDFGFTQPAFSKEAKALAGKLKKLKAKDIMELMHVSKDIAELNVNRNKKWYLSAEPTEEVRPAAFLFTGEVYRGLSVETLSAAELEKAQKNLRILSGMYGLLKPMDLIHPYRLEMGTRWDIKENVSNLYQFWGDKLTKSLLKETDKGEAIINLASNEYNKAINWKSVKNPVVTPVFKEFKNGEYKIVMVFAKHARGAMARYIIRNEIQNPEELKAYNVDGYAFDERLSSDQEWVFTR
ncbi:peroxide stress protein YaaA [Fluviicola sp.]|uniref:peroxide stress protein YaaA n=1 Tax=Fluviicola sp. TaxID=1917219 RepID=UPI0031D75BEC